MQHRLHGYAHECAYTLLAILHSRHPVSEQNEKALQIRRHKSVFLILIHLLFKTRARPQLLLHQAPLRLNLHLQSYGVRPRRKGAPDELKHPATTISPLWGETLWKTHHLWFSHAHARANDGKHECSIQYWQNTQAQDGWRKKKAQGEMKKKGRVDKMTLVGKNKTNICQGTWGHAMLEHQRLTV